MEYVANSRGEISRYAKYIGYLRRLLLGALVLTFGWLKVQDVALFQVARSVQAQTLMISAMVLYFTSWAAGSNFDIELRKETFVIPPSARALVWSVPYFIALASLFGILCWLVRTPPQFAEVLLALWMLNWFAWWRARVRLFPQVLTATGAGATPEINAILSALREYEVGSWQGYRFLMGGVFILLINGAVFSGLDKTIAFYLAWPADVVFAASIFAFVFSMEAWMWYWRTRIHFTVSAVRWLSARFTIGAGRP